MKLEVDKGLRAKLTGDATVSGYVDNRVYKTLAPMNAALPYIVYSLNAGGDTNETPGEPVDLRYSVKAISANALEAAQIADAIRNALHEASISADSPWTVYRCQHLTVFEFAEQVERLQFWHIGGIYRIRVYKTG